MQKADIEITKADSGPMKIKEMVKLLVRIEVMKSVQKFYDLCPEVILGKDWLHRQGASIEFSPTGLVVNGVRMPLGAHLKCL